ncbi:glycoside hydrolase family 13 protein [Caloranaerobacter ferrireducens]|uniref:glycoside hydrolase family 13 protein n=1 Tax=Caloranaerobacter ferrireducens TaxID=1323370 RepID=UPI00114C9256|nr:alpha-glucosidase [Caloranaerobacter ferrireducens]
MKNWWKKAIFYEIYIRSFCDGNGDGIGDFIGITKKLDYLKDLGVDCIWLTPFYKSPKVDNGYDISDYYEIDADYGTMEDFETFLKEAHKRDIKVIVDLVLNHTSDKHPWFIESKSSLQSPKRDWYIWKDPKEGGVPNNWESFFEGSAWEYDSNTKQYYYHAFAKEQVDLNWRNEDVKKAMFDVIKFWLEKGIDGFRLDVINFLMVDKQFKDNPYDEKGKQIHKYDKDLPETLNIVEELRKLVDQYPNKVLVGEVGTENVLEAAPYLDEEKRLHLVFNFNLGSIQKFDVNKIFEELKSLEENLNGGLPTIFFSSHDMPRHVTRFGNDNNREDMAKLFSMLILTARGVPFIYQGDELGMTDIYIKDIKDMRDVAGILAYEKAVKEGKTEDEAIKIANEAGRDSGRNPVQWDSSKYAGFSSTAPWLPVNENYKELNAKKQSEEEDSVLNFYKKLIRIRKKSDALLRGEYVILQREDDVIYYIRKTESERYAVFLNFSDKYKEISLDNFNANKVEMIVSSKRKELNIKDKVKLFPYEALLVRC